MINAAIKIFNFKIISSRITLIITQMIIEKNSYELPEKSVNLTEFVS